MVIEVGCQDLAGDWGDPVQGRVKLKVGGEDGVEECCIWMV